MRIPCLALIIMAMGADRTVSDELHRSPRSRRDASFDYLTEQLTTPDSMRRLASGAVPVHGLSGLFGVGGWDDREPPSAPSVPPPPG